MKPLPTSWRTTSRISPAGAAGFFWWIGAQALQVEQRQDHDDDQHGDQALAQAAKEVDDQGGAPAEGARGVRPRVGRRLVVLASAAATLQPGTKS